MTYAGPTLEDMDAIHNRACMDRLGDSIAYQPLGGTFAPARGYVEFGDQVRDLQTGQVIAQDITVEMMCEDTPVRPSGACRITINKLPGQMFRPINVRLGDDGGHWKFEVERMNV